jgi:hypothetical protein
VLTKNRLNSNKGTKSDMGVCPSRQPQRAGPFSPSFNIPSSAGLASEVVLQLGNRRGDGRDN